MNKKVENSNETQTPKLGISDVSGSNQFNIGDKVIKNEETWEQNDFDSWGRGIGVGIIVEPPFEMDKGEVDVRCVVV